MGPAFAAAAGTPGGTIVGLDEQDAMLSTLRLTGHAQRDGDADEQMHVVARHARSVRTVYGGVGEPGGVAHAQVGEEVHAGFHKGQKVGRVLVVGRPEAHREPHNRPGAGELRIDAAGDDIRGHQHARGHARGHRPTRRLGWAPQRPMGTGRGCGGARNQKTGREHHQAFGQLFCHGLKTLMSIQLTLVSRVQRKFGNRHAGPIVVDGGHPTP